MNTQGHFLEMCLTGPGSQVLGSVISFTGSCASELKARIAAALSSFFKHRPFLCHRGVPIGQKLHPLRIVIRPCLLWAGYILPPARGYVNSWKTLQLAMVSIIARRGRNKAEGEGWPDWYTQTRREARQIIRDMGYRCWSNDARDRFHTWAGR